MGRTNLMMRETTENSPKRTEISRRDFLKHSALGATALVAAPILGCRSDGDGYRAGRNGPATITIPLNLNWLFGGKFTEAAQAPGFGEGAFSPITLPHCVTQLSWQKWEQVRWADVWIYRRHFELPPSLAKKRVFLDFSAVMISATPTINGHALSKHMGGYLPFSYEITDLLAPKDNVLSVAVDGRWQSVPPDGSPRGPASVDYLQPAGITRQVTLRMVPPIFISDVFTKPIKVLDSDRRVEVLCSLDADAPVAARVEIQVELRKSDRLIARACQTVPIEKAGPAEVKLTLANLGNIALWNVNAPRLYEVVATLFVGGTPVHEYGVQIGLRDARFELDGFFLNGDRLQIFGLNRHELYPYVGGAMPWRVQRRDAEILRHELNCNMVRCSHYPQSEAFLQACDELGLMVWEEPPGWQYLGDAAWQDLMVRDVQDMIRRDRNHPSIVIWGVRVNESANNPELYRRTTALAKALDDSRPASGSMTPDSRKKWESEWREDVFAFDDYHTAPDGSVGIDDPLPGVPYMLAEAVGQFNYGTRPAFSAKYRRAGELALQQQQALRHAQAHSKAGGNPRNCGVIAWCGFDYGSLMNSHNGVKCPGVVDSFRIPKLGASFYQAQGDPKSRPVIQPNFYWDFGAQTPRGPGKQAAIFSNCERLELFINGQRHATLHPDSVNFPHLRHAPCFTDLELDGARRPELRIDGYVGDRLVLTKSFSSDSTHDQLFLETDDKELIGDGVDATRLVFKVVDKFGAERALGGGAVSFDITGPGVIVGDNPFELAETGGVGAIWVKGVPNNSGRITVSATHSALGKRSVVIHVR